MSPVVLCIYCSPGTDLNILTDYHCCTNAQDCFHSCVCHDDSDTLVYAAEVNLVSAVKNTAYSCSHEQDVTVQCSKSVIRPYTL